MHVFSRVFETIEKFAGRCYRGFLIYQVERFMHVINLTSLIGSCAYELLMSF